MKHTQHNCHCGGISRREFLKTTAAAGAGLLLPGYASAGDNIHDMQGPVYVNKAPANPATPIRPGDLINVAHGGRLTFVLGQDAYTLRGGTSLQLERSNNLLLTGLRLITGGLLAVFGKGEKTIQTRSAIIGIRGTGIYLDTAPDKTYFCTCYGETELSVNGESRMITAEHHRSAWIYTPDGGTPEFEDMGMFMGDFQHHTDDQLRANEALVGRSVPFDS